MNKTNQFWLNRIATKKANSPQKNAKQIWKELQSQQKKLRSEGRAYRTDPPSQKTIQKYLAELKDDPEQLAPYLYFSWPRSMQDGPVPWEASEACFDLLRTLPRGKRDEVPVALVERYWWVTQADPSMPIAARIKLAARWLIFEEYNVPEGIEWCSAVIADRLWRRSEVAGEVGVWDMTLSMMQAAIRLGLTDVELELLDWQLRVLDDQIGALDDKKDS